MGCVGRDSFGTRTSSTTLLGRVPVVPASEGAADPWSSRARPAWQLPPSPRARPPWGVRVPESPSGWMSENMRPRRGARRGGAPVGSYLPAFRGEQETQGATRDPPPQARGPGMLLLGQGSSLCSSGRGVGAIAKAWWGGRVAGAGCVGGSSPGAPETPPVGACWWAAFCPGVETSSQDSIRTLAPVSYLLHILSSYIFKLNSRRTCHNILPFHI